MSLSKKWWLPIWVSDQNGCTHIPPIRAKYPAHLILINSISFVICLLNYAVSCQERRQYAASSGGLSKRGLEILTAVVMQSSVFWDIAQCSPKLTEISENHVASILRVEETSIKQVANRALLTTCFIYVSCLAYSSTLNMETAFLRNVGWLPADYMALHSSKSHPSVTAVPASNQINLSLCLLIVTSWWRRGTGGTVPRILNFCMP
jgi:hypothetical protein